MAYKQLSVEERHQIAAMRGQSIAMGKIAVAIGRHRSTVYREVKRNRSDYDGAYRAVRAGERENQRAASAVAT